MKRRNLFVYLFIFIVFVTKSVYSQTSISGIINQYTVIDSIYPTKDTIEVQNPSLYNSNDTVMVYQVKGADVRKDTSDSNRHNFGTFASINSANNSGKYELILVEKVDGNKVIFKVSLNNDYDIEGIVQLIRVPSYENVSVDGELTCKNWEDTTGGVLVLMVSDTLFLNADINVTGKGFRGAEPFLSDGTCAITDSVLYKSYYFNENADTVSAGYKGEGVSEFDPVYRKGLGRWANGGGGGNGRFTGGGGGGNAGNGGTGGAEDTTVCGGVAWSYDNWKGLGGNDGYGFKGISGTINDSTIFLGGGGGSGTYMNGFTATNGGNGGGIVIIIAKNIKTSGRQIIANGDSVSVVATASAGGGGAGGVVVFDVDSIIGDLSIYCNGGNGGFVEHLGAAGPGGGGGGGVIFWKELQPYNVSVVKVSEGVPGYALDAGWPDTKKSYYASRGAIGSKKNNIKTPLTGFLYNSIISNQDVCWGFAPKLLEGSSLRGGFGPGSYTYQWQDSPNGADWTDIAGATQEDYQAPVLTDTIYYRRVAYSGPITDYGTDVKVVVHDTLQNNNIFGDDLIICIGNEGDTITGTEVVLGGDTENYNYIWQFRTDSANWSNFTSLNNTTLLPGIITDTSYVRRIVISGACRDTVAPPIEIIGLPQIANNIISADPEICYNDIPSLIIGNNPENGDGAYTYQWQIKTNSPSWNDISGANLKDYQPPALDDTTYYKRIVYSDDCFDESEPDTIIVLALIEDNNILTSIPASTCYNTQKQIDADLPTGGRNIYEYQWQESPDELGWTDILTDAENQNYLSYNLTDKTYFRRFVKSGACENTSDSIEVTIDPLPVAVLTGFTDTTCSGTDINLKFTVTEGQQSYILTYNDGYDDYVESGFINDLNTVTISPATTQGSKGFNYTIVAVEDQNECFATDITGLGELTVYGNPLVNVGIDEENCSLEYTFGAVSSLGTGKWTQIAGEVTGVFEDNTIANTKVNVGVAGDYTFEWKETNWECVDSANVQIKFYEKIENVNAGVDTSLHFIDKYTLAGTYLDPDEEVDVITTWNKISDNDGEIIYPNALTTDVIDLFDADNTGIIISWTVEKGVCEVKADTLTLKLEEIFTPTGFTPNGDGINDFLIFNGLENSASNELIIYNRWGTEVYRMSNLTNEPGWDGKNNSGNDLPEDTYYYILTVTSKKNSTENHKGFFVIKRF